MLNAGDYERMRLKIEENIIDAFEQYIEANDCRNLFLKPGIAYFDAKSSIFDLMAEQGISESMKRIFRAGKTLICFTLPFSDEVIRGDDEKWAFAYGQSIHLIMKLNSAIKSALKTWGRVTSSLNTPMDWDRKKPGERWSHKTAGAICGLGYLTSSGLFIDNHGNIARVSGVVTDCDIAGRYEKDPKELLEKILRYYVSEEEIEKCPVGAITKQGTDRFKCQEWCSNINEIVPAPDVCAKCLRKCVEY